MVQQTTIELEQDVVKTSIRSRLEDNSVWYEDTARIRHQNVVWHFRIVLKIVRAQYCAK